MFHSRIITFVKRQSLTHVTVGRGFQRNVYPICPKSNAAKAGETALLPTMDPACILNKDLARSLYFAFNGTGRWLNYGVSLLSCSTWFLVFLTPQNAFLRESKGCFG